ncbi:hypothetical protein RYX36_036202 [Vicia faba]
MASAQVLPNNSASSRKQEHLEAGKHRLEEFRKKKAAERVKKAASSDSVPNSDADQIRRLKKSLRKLKMFELMIQMKLPHLMASEEMLLRLGQVTRKILVEERSDIDEAKRYNASTFITFYDVSQNSKAIHTGDVAGFPYGATNHQSNFLCSQESQEIDSSTSQSILQGMNESQSNKNNSSVKDVAVTDVSSPYFPSKIIRKNSVDSLQITKQYPSYSSFQN